jgi:GT2 family glycosyltransferase
MIESVDFCILSYNRLDDLRACLAAAEQARTGADDRVIVVDNGSTDGTCEYLRSYVHEHPFCTFVENSENLGVAAGRNVAYRLSTSDIVISLDDDSVPAADIVTRTREAFRRFPDAGVVAYRIVHPRTREVQNDCGPRALEVSHFHGAGYAVHRRTTLTAGLLDEECRFGAEELEYSIRIRCAGNSVIYVPDIVVLHNSRIRIGKHAQDTAAQWCYNFARIFFKYFPAPIALSIIASSYGKTIGFGWRHGLRFWIRALRGLYVGAAAGLKQRTPLPAEVLRFYTSPSTVPAFFFIIGWRMRLVQQLSMLFTQRRPVENSHVGAAIDHVTFNKEGCKDGEPSAGRYPSQLGN